MTPFSTYKLITYGCQMNEYDSEVVASQMEGMGAVPVENEQDADVILLNTCCVRNSAENKVYGRLGQYKPMMEQNPGKVLAVLGCLAQKDKEELINRFPHVNLVLGTHNLHELPGLLKEVLEKKKIARADEAGAQFLNPDVRKSPVTGYIPVSIGCDCFCSFCIVPYVRGRIQSRPVDDVVEQVKKLVSGGVGEIFLLGQNVNTYGFDLEDRPTFADLLSAVNGVDAVRRIRFTSPHPKDFSKELIDTLGMLENAARWVHLPLQSGSDSVLRRMNRKYDTGRYEYIVNRLREKIPGVALSTDLIVGFPGETEEEFEDGLKFIKRMRFDQAFMFAYSLRTGTAAEKLPGHLPKDVKMQRLYKLIDMQNDISRNNNEAQLGQFEEVLVERVSKKDKTRVTGRTSGNKVVNFPGDESMIGKFYDVKLEAAYTWGFVGSRVWR